MNYINTIMNLLTNQTLKDVQLTYALCIHHGTTAAKMPTSNAIQLKLDAEKKNSMHLHQRMRRSYDAFKFYYSLFTQLCTGICANCSNRVRQTWAVICTAVHLSTATQFKKT